MKKASIISIGNEILSGMTTDTNSSYLSGQLLSISIPVCSFYTVGDDIEAIVRVLNLAAEDADIVIITGGIGPTDDDLTRQGLAKFLGVELQFNDELLGRIEKYYTKRSLEMPANNKIQAYMPAGAKRIANHLGTAAGIMAEFGDKPIFVLPGVPSEMKRMFEESVLAELKRTGTQQNVVMRKLKCFGTGESNIAELLGDMMQRGRDPLINCTASKGIITIYIIATGEDKKTAEKLAVKDEELLRSKLGNLIYGTDEQTLAEVVGEELIRQGKTVAVAESCTGGYLAKLLTDSPGASGYFAQGWITYSNSAKVNELSVAAELIEKYGAVSEKVAGAMACGARGKADTDFAIGITGIAGPTGGSEQKPVGLVYISIDSAKGSETRRFVFSRDRETIRFRAAQTALNMLRLALQD